MVALVALADADASYQALLLSLLKFRQEQLAHRAVWLRGDGVKIKDIHILGLQRLQTVFQRRAQVGGSGERGAGGVGLEFGRQVVLVAPNGVQRAAEDGFAATVAWRGVEHVD